MKLTGARKDVNGWIYISVYGDPYKRGFAHGHLVAHELSEIMKMLEFIIHEDYGRTRRAPWWRRMSSHPVLDDSRFRMRASYGALNPMK